MVEGDLPAPVRDHLAHARVAIAVASGQADHELVFVNAAFEQLTGYDAGEVVGRNCRILQGRAADQPANEVARREIRAFLSSPARANIRTVLVNFHRDGRPFVNLLYMARVRYRGNPGKFIIASQFDISHTRPELLTAYDEALGQVVSRSDPALIDSGMVVEGSLATIGNSVAMIAQAKLMLEEMKDDPFA
ncbi:PAS domain-containing protein [Porphyrobacter sp. GA68]|uniref:PAS domain-containing protein n=1 Tax=Porphyrobacter sp. GA68 TaxID=2883480 RepID=UPI001D188F5A|nr:PAS domain-containing protein [Porphyrobacter sp. GA68]